jgi:hypothetical protein
MTVARANFASALLPNGTVLAAGGTNVGYTSLRSAELYDPATRRWTATDSMGTARQGFTATLLKDGTVLVAGGGGSNVIFDTAEIYVP